jgi:primosomal protein N' (replication factor Y)
MTDRDTTTWADVAVDGVGASMGGGVLTYGVPDALAGELEPRQLVWAPLRSKLVLGFVVRVHDEAPVGFDSRDLHSRVEPVMAITVPQWALAEWLARETASGLYATASLFLPRGIANRTVDWYRLAPDHETFDDALLTPTQRRIVDLLREEGELKADTLKTRSGKALTSVLPALEELGWVERIRRVDQRRAELPTTRYIRLVDPDIELPASANRQREVIDALKQMARTRRSGESDLVEEGPFRERVDVTRSIIKALADKGAIEEVELTPDRAPRPAAAPAPRLTAEQERVWAAFRTALEAGDTTPHLLFGVTGSGKTEIYLRAVGWALARDRTAIVLVPEIGLATQVVRRFIDRFPGRVAVLHSALKDAERLQVWEGIAEGRFDVVVGPRSALFAPMDRLGVIIIDEEHDGAYKQDVEPRYHAREVAKFLARQSGAGLIMGSATPAVESAWHAEGHDYRKLALPDRVSPSLLDASGTAGALALPKVEIIDLRLDLRQGNTSLLSGTLQGYVRDSLDRGEQAILLLNRRGQSTVVLCRSCGSRLICPYCDIPLVFHRDRHLMICHRCNFRERPPAHCPMCEGPLDYFGAGTQRVEEEARKLSPGASVLRWDQDSVRRQGGYEAMLRRVERREADIVVGTQMVAKGFDLPGVTTIGVINADTMVHLPDFRGAERTFQLLTQVAGRAGRRGPGGRVAIQTYTPRHYAILAAAAHDYSAFYDAEIAFREQHGYPPFTRLVRYVVREKNERQAALDAEKMALAVAKHARRAGVEIDMLGPTPAFVAKVRGEYQWQFVVRAEDLDAMLDDIPTAPGWVVDIDPQSMM